MTDPSSSFCVLPWMHLFADESGTMWPCCRTIGTRLPNMDDASGTPRKVHHPDGIAQGMNTATMRQVRTEMLAGKRPKVCERCYMFEDLGMRSHRQSQNETWGETVRETVAATAPDGRITPDIRTADIRLGNVCNLKCRMCSPQSSRALISEWAEAHDVPEDHAYFDQYRSVDWFETPAFWEMLEHAAPRLERINFAGGEPLLIEGMFSFLERMVAVGRAKDLTISYNTNATLAPDRIRTLWPAFKAIRLTASLDGLGAVNDYIRAPSKWERIAANMAYFDNHADALNLRAGLGTNTAVQVLNVFSLDPLIAYLLTELRTADCPNLSIVTYPEHLSVRILPPPLKALADIRLRDLADKLRTGWPDDVQRPALIAAVEGVREYMGEADHTDKLPDFLRWTRLMDRRRNQDIRDSLPELSPLFDADQPDRVTASSPERVNAPSPERVNAPSPERANASSPERAGALSASSLSQEQTETSSP